MPLAMKNFKTILGRGEAEDENASYYAGNEAFMKEKGVSLDDMEILWTSWQKKERLH